MENKFKGKVAPIDKEQLWASISTHESFPKKSNKKYRVAAFFIGFIFITCGGIYSTFQSYNTSISKESILKIPQYKSLDSNVDQCNESKNTLLNTRIEQPIVQSQFNQNDVSTIIKNKKPKVEKLLNTVIDNHKTHLKQQATPTTWNFSTNEKFGITQYNKPNKYIQSSVRTLKFEALTGIGYLPLQILNITATSIPFLKVTKQKIGSQEKKWSISAKYLIGLNINKIDVIDDNENLKWFYDNNTFVESHAVRFELNRRINAKWSTGIGLMNSNLIQKYSLTKGTVVYQKLNNEEAPYYSKTKIDSISILYHHHNILDILFNIERKLHFQSVQFSFSLGLGANITYDFNGHYRNKAFELSEIKRNNYKQKLSPFVFGRIGMSRNILQNTSISFGVETQSTRVLSEKESGIINSYFQIRSDIGIQYHF